MPLVVVPLIVLLFKAIKRHYDTVADGAARSRPTTYRPAPHEPHGRRARRPRAPGRARGARVRQVAAPEPPRRGLRSSPTSEDQRAIEQAVGRAFGFDVPLEIVHSPYRELVAAGDALPRRARRPLRERHRHRRASPSSWSTSWWAHLLHNQSALLLKGRLLFRKGTVVTSVPYHVMRVRRRRQATSRRAPRADATAIVGAART